jgi:hypothetical protein
MKRNRSKLGDEERQAIIAAYRADPRIHSVMLRFKRSFATVKELVTGVNVFMMQDDQVHPSTHDSSNALVLTSPTPDTKRTYKQGRKKKIDDLALVNQALESSMTNVLEEPLAHFMAKARQLLPHAHTIVIDMVNMRAKAHIAQELDLVVGGGK